MSILSSNDDLSNAIATHHNGDAGVRGTQIDPDDVPDVGALEPRYDLRRDARSTGDEVRLLHRRRPGHG